MRSAQALARIVLHPAGTILHFPSFNSRQVNHLLSPTRRSSNLLHYIYGVDVAATAHTTADA
jgi:hypothetical protein